MKIRLTALQLLHMNKRANTARLIGSLLQLFVVYVPKMTFPTHVYPKPNFLCKLLLEEQRVGPSHVHTAGTNKMQEILKCVLFCDLQRNKTWEEQKIFKLIFCLIYFKATND
jgi:hypothetical protein